ncbi:MAG: type IV toxin-antitoxin system AbiEi family antitoxin domain-containing protein [Actinomycetota bacterium]
MRSLYDTERTRVGVDLLIGSLAAGQHGVFTRAQAIDSGVNRGEIRWRLETRRWVHVYPGVYRLAGSPETWRQRAMAACLHWGVDAALSHRAAAKLRSLCALRHARVELLAPRNRNRYRASGIVVHRLSVPLPHEDVSKIDGIPVTKPARTLLDLASTESGRMTARFVDDALRRGLVTLSFLERWLKDPRRKHQRGAPLLRELVEERAIRGVTESQLEADALTLLNDAGLPIPMVQYIVEDRGRIVARLDLAYPEQRVAIELDGFRFHDTRDSFDAERARGNELQAMGWNVLRVTAKHLERDRDEVVAWVRRVLRERAGR